jgi:molybdopterin synthase catalytic subunit
MERRSADCWILVTPDALDVSSVDLDLRDERVGGICVFVGTTRRYTGDEETEELRYEAFSEMAVSEMERLAAEARSRWPITRVVMHHRLGTVRPAEASVLVGVSAAHRGEAFEACRFLIDTLKEQVPVWKREVRSDGRLEWVQPGGDPDLNG